MKYITSEATKLKKDYPVQMKNVYKLEKSEYSAYGVQICEEQNGIDWNSISKYEKSHPGIKFGDLPKELSDNSWYNLLLSKGEKFVKETFYL